MKKTKLITALVFVGMIVGISTTSFLMKDRTFSENENRILAKMPAFTIEKFMNGKFQDELEEYLNDQICFRDGWISLKTGVQTACGDTDIGGAYLGKDGYDFEKITPQDVNEKLVGQNTQFVKKYFDACTNEVDPSRISFLLVPTSGLVMEDKLPNHAILFDEDAYMDQIEEQLSDYTVVDVRTELKEKNEEYLYYRTDHHWTTNGAFVAYEKWGDATGNAVHPMDEYELEDVSASFRGSLYSKVLNANSTKDTITSYCLKDSASSLNVTGDGEQLAGIYDSSKLEEKDQYAYFFGGNYGEVHITNENASGDVSEKNLLVIKDSFANSFVPFLTEDFANIYMIDLRYYSGNMEQYMRDKKITDVLVLYNISNFISDKNLFKLTKGQSTSDSDTTGTTGTENQNAEVNYPSITSDLSVEDYGSVVTVGDAGYELYSYKDDVAQNYADAVNQLADSLKGTANVYDIVVPLSSEIVFPDNLKDQIKSSNQKDAMDSIYSKMDENVVKVPIYDTLMQHREEYIYFRSDHHWTQLGAYYAYAEWCKAKGIEAESIDSYKTMDFDGFLGSFYNDTSDSDILANPDTVHTYLPNANSTMHVTPSKGDTYDWKVIFDVSNYQAINKYSTFIAGDNPFTEISNQNLTDGSACLVVKESFGNAFVPFLVDHYQHVYVVDYRYWTGNLVDLAKEKNAQDIIMVNNVSMIRNKYLVGQIKGIIQ